jgi:hypothetical protein
MAWDWGNALKGSLFGLGGVVGGGLFGDQLSSMDPTNVKRTQIGPAQTGNTQQFLQAAQKKGSQVSAPQLQPAPTATAATLNRQQLQPLQQQQQQLVATLTSPQAQANQQAQALEQNRLFTEQALRAQMAGAASNRGTGAALANRNAQNQAAAMQMQGAGQAALQQQNQEIQRQQLAASLLAQQSGVEAGLSQSQAQLQQQAALANQALQGQFGLTGAEQALRAQQLNQAAELQRLGLQGQAQMGMDQSSNANLVAQAQLDANRQQQIREGKSGLLSGLGGALSTAATIFSDKRTKKDIKATKGEATRSLDKMAGSGGQEREMLDKLQAYEYRYKHEGKDATPQLGIMAQDLEKSRLGKQMVVQDELTGMKMVDFGRGFGALLASQAELNKRLKAIEATKGRIA